MSSTLPESMTKGELLEMSGLTAEELAEKVGVKVSSVKNRNGIVPRVWFDRLGYSFDVYDDENVESYGRENEQTPRPPEGAKIQQPARDAGPVDYTQLSKWIEGAYRDGSKMAFGENHQLTVVVNRHAAAAGKAWSRYIESNPRLAAWLERMMVGTPAGEVIAVHVAIGFGYYFARDSAQRAVREAAEREQAEQQAEWERSNGGIPSAEPTPVYGLG